MIANRTSNSPPLPARVWMLWSVACLLAGCETWVNFAALPGLNWTLTTLATSMALATFSYFGMNSRRTWSVPLLLACALAGGAAVTADSSMDTLIFFATMGALSTAVLMVRRQGHTEPGVRELLLSPAIAGVEVLREARRRSGEAFGSVRAESNLPVMRGIALAAPVTVVFGLLLSNADPLLAFWRDCLVQALVDFSFLGKAVCFAAFGLISLGSFGIALSVTPANVAAPAQSNDRGGFVLGTTERVIVLAAVVVLFGLFLLLQLSHLFGNAAAIHGNGITYARTAHQGFIELTLVASLCSALLIFLARSAVSGRLQLVERTLSVSLIVQTQLLLASAFYRMELYEGAYGFTELRLLVQVYIGVVCVALIALALELTGRPDFTRLSRYVAVIVLLTITGLAYWNHAGWIARANLDRFDKTGTLDVPYVAVSLGPDAAPDLIEYLPRLPGPLRTRLRTCLHGVYESNLNSVHPWYEWNYRRSRLEAALHREYAETVAGSLEEQRALCYR